MDMWEIISDPIGCIQSVAMFYVVPVASIRKTIVYLRLRAILGRSAGSSRICNSECGMELVHTMFIVASLHYRSGGILVFGWTMMYKWGNPVATLPSVGGDYTSLSLNDVISANQCHPGPCNMRKRHFARRYVNYGGTANCYSAVGSG
eukprot:2859653-Pleurochrysis_carterae.AAC.1